MDCAWPSFLTWLKLLGLAIVHIIFAVYVLQDGQRRPRLQFDTPAWLWALLVLVTGILGAVIYWLANCARFVRNQTDWPRSSEVDGSR